MSQRKVPSLLDDDGKDEKDGKDGRDGRDGRGGSGEGREGRKQRGSSQTELPKSADGESNGEEDVERAERGEQEEPSENDSLLGGGRMSTPSTPRSTHSHLASACSIPGAIIDAAARSVVRRPQRVLEERLRSETVVEGNVGSVQNDAVGLGRESVTYDDDQCV